MTENTVDDIFKELEEADKRKEWLEKNKPFPDCPDCKNTMNKLYEFSNGADVEGHYSSSYLFQCPFCKTVAMCGKPRFYNYYYIISDRAKKE